MTVKRINMLLFFLNNNPLHINEIEISIPPSYFINLLKLWLFMSFHVHVRCRTTRKGVSRIPEIVAQSKKK
uniref:DDE-1 domain-containing protein n=1 Tax=Steinernema glaseri TaxID=37863 RepID=A0A1I7YM31_9BILA